MFVHRSLRLLHWVSVRFYLFSVYEKLNVFETIRHLVPFFALLPTIIILTSSVELPGILSVDISAEGQVFLQGTRRTETARQCL